MGEIVRKERVCDICGASGDVKRFRVTDIEKAKTISPDLCPDHRPWIEEAFRRLPNGKRGRSRARKVYTEKEIRALREKNGGSK